MFRRRTKRTEKEGKRKAGQPDPRRMHSLAAAAMLFFASTPPCPAHPFYRDFATAHRGGGRGGEGGVKEFSIGEQQEKKIQ
jgi:hypothetical protein